MSKIAKNQFGGIKINNYIVFILLLVLIFLGFFYYKNNSIKEKFYQNFNTTSMKPTSYTTSTTDITSVTPSEIALFTQGQIEELTPSQIKAMSPLQIQSLTPYQIFYLSSNQISSFTQFQFSGLTSNQIFAFGKSHIQALSNEQINYLTKLQISLLTPNQISALESTQITQNLCLALNLEQVTALNPDAYNTFQSIISNLKNESSNISFLYEKQLSSLKNILNQNNYES